MAPSQSLDLLEHFRLGAVVKAECTTHIEYKTDRVRGVRKEKVEKRWYREQKLGRGTFGEVWLEVRREDDDVERRAVKIIDKSWSLQVDYKKELLALAKFSKLQYQEEEVFVKFFGWFEDPSNLFLSMEYFELGDLEQHITESITVDDLKDIIKDVLIGLRIMHSENFAHRDLKPSNIFVVEKPPTSKWWVKIGDFGISKRVEGDITALRTPIGTPAYQAPEIDGSFDTDEPTSVYDNAVDIWSLGCVIYRIATQRVPFPRPVDVVRFCDGKLPFPKQPLLAKMSTEGVEFVKSLVVPNPRERLSAESALKTSWLLQRRRDTILETEEPAERSVPTIAQTANANELAAGVSSPDGITVVSTSWDRTVRLWDSVTEAAQRTLKGHTHKVYGVTFSPDGKTVASASWDNTIKLWDSRTGAAQHTLKGHMREVHSVTFSPDGKTVASASWDNTVKLWDSRTGAAQRTLTCHQVVYSVAFSPDGKTVASATGHSIVRVCDSVTGALRHVLRGHRHKVYGIAFSPDDETVASASADKTVKLWDFRTGAVQRTLEGHTDDVYSVTFSPNGKTVASASCDNTIKLWDSRTGAAQRTLKGHTDSVYSVTFSPDGKTVASASGDNTVKFWDPWTGAAWHTLKGHTDHVTSIAFSPDGKMVASASLDKTVKLWDSMTGVAY
ncbi:hypothetical protein GJ744_000694 [Endocarpon pusillum]|uniref:Protein kinase domain-containing protein n=1 Tax=Endocarpon pusillum TaxID=364733 RepID=A0A8H7AD37_9EURO|nr:hypothetical protein GJ744_000694 [Endocarpon pusillum]